MRFLAILELYKRGMVDLEQPSNFGELHITWLGVEPPTSPRQAVEEYQG